jgi:metallophosphoesterase (TIGR03767 family)
MRDVCAASSLWRRSRHRRFLVISMTLTSFDGTVVAAARGRGGYRQLVRGPGDAHLVRRELASAPSRRLRPLVCFLHLSDLHVTDVQSPARAEFLDRLGDEDSPFAARVGRVGLYRAQESLTYHVVEAMARAAGEIEFSPVTGAPIDFAVSTGDATDNCQANELDAYIGLLDGGVEICADSGSPGVFEGLGAAAFYDRRYWHPDGTPTGESDDIPRARRGFPVVPGLLDALRRPFHATGLGLPWYAVYGNHDALFGGTLAPGDALCAVATGSQKQIALDPAIDPLALLAGNETAPSGADWGLGSGTSVAVTADHRRRPVIRREWITAHLESSAAPFGHGFAKEGAENDRAYYAFDAGLVRVVVLDTVNAAGGWQGSIDATQFDWLENELVDHSGRFVDRAGRLVHHDGADRIVVLLSHHPLETLVNDFSPDGARRVLANEVSELLGRFPNVVCWANGHTHLNAVSPMTGAHGGGFWQVTTASHIDWPQQSRVVDLAVDEESGDLVIATTMVDHAGLIDPRGAGLDEPLALAGWSRELSANAWQGRVNGMPIGLGTARDRNVILPIPAPFPLGPR